jgi:hypothetical protein
VFVGGKLFQKVTTVARAVCAMSNGRTEVAITFCDISTNDLAAANQGMKLRYFTRPLNDQRIQES